MKKITKIALVLLTSFALGFSANAGELTVTGTAKATYNIQSSGGNAGNDLGKGLGITNEITFGASGELDNGFTWTYSMALDPDAVASANGAAQNDDTIMTLGTPYGTLSACISACGLNTSLKFSAAAYAVGIDTGLAQIIDPVDLGARKSPNRQVRLPGLWDAITREQELAKALGKVRQRRLEPCTRKPKLLSQFARMHMKKTIEDLFSDLPLAPNGALETSLWLKKSRTN
jgi:hypothetical protein